MNKINDVGSVYGQAQRTSYEYMKLLNKEYQNYKVLVVDDKDGLHSLPFLNHGASKVVMYEPDKRFIKGGKIGNIELQSIDKRKYYNKYKDKLEIRIENFYEAKVDDTYEFVYCYRSLHERHNKHITMDKKLKKLMSSVKPGGYLYVFYHIAKVEKDYSNFYKEQYVRKNIMRDVFSKDNWKVETMIEREQETLHKGHPGHEKDHTHLVGYIFAKKLNNRIVHKYHYNIISVK